MHGNRAGCVSDGRSRSEKKNNPGQFGRLTDRINPGQFDRLTDRINPGQFDRLTDRINPGP